MSEARRPTVLTVVSSLDPVRFNFTISEADYLAYARAVKAEGSNRSEGNLPLELVLADGSVYPQKGRVSVVGRGVSAETGTLPIQATFPNPGGLLRPGGFGRVRFPITTRKNAIVIPQRAVQELQGTYNVFVVGPDSIVQAKTVKPGNRVGSDWVISLWLGTRRSNRRGGPAEGAAGRQGAADRPEASDAGYFQESRQHDRAALTYG
jgi:membrane fusion protein (multidrug efflux system)